MLKKTDAAGALFAVVVLCLIAGCGSGEARSSAETTSAPAPVVSPVGTPTSSNDLVASRASASASSASAAAESSRRSAQESARRSSEQQAVRSAAEQSAAEVARLAAERSAAAEASRSAAEQSAAEAARIAAEESAASAALPQPRAAGPDASGCDIKGNINSKGEHIYHVKGKSPSYDDTVIDESAGERWFCTESEAQAAGWRAPKNSR